MRFLVVARVPTEAGNQWGKDPNAIKTLENYLNSVKAEAAYFSEADGERTFYIVVDIPSEGIVPGRTKPKEFNGQIPWITLPDVKGLYVAKSQDNLAVTKEDAEKVRMKVMPKGTVLISCVGQFGIVCIASCPVVPNQQFHGFVCQDKIPPEYVAFALMIQFEQMKKLSSATTIAYMNKTKCNSINIPLAPLAEQHRIVEEIERRFSVADEVEKVVDEGLKRVKRLRQSILKRAFEGKLVPQDPTDESAEKLLQRIKEERVNKMPATTEKRKRKNKASKQIGLIRYVK